MDVQRGHEAQKFRTAMQHRKAAVTCSMDMKHGPAACTGSMDTQHAHAAWQGHEAQKFGKDIQHRKAAGTCINLIQDPDFSPCQVNLDSETRFSGRRLDRSTARYIYKAKNGKLLV
jgi:hypothetical protein